VGKGEWAETSIERKRLSFNRGKIDALKSYNNESEDELVRKKKRSGASVTPHPKFSKVRGTKIKARKMVACGRRSELDLPDVWEKTKIMQRVIEEKIATRTCPAGKKKSKRREMGPSSAAWR